MKYIIICVLAMMNFALKAHAADLYEVSSTPATELVAGNMYVLQNREHQQKSIEYSGSTVTCKSSFNIKQFSGFWPMQPYFFTAGEDGIRLNCTLTNINDVNDDFGYGNVGGGTILAKPRRAESQVTYFTVKDAEGQLLMMTEAGDCYGVNATNPLPNAQWIAYEVTKHQHQWDKNLSTAYLHICSVCYTNERHVFSEDDAPCADCGYTCKHYFSFDLEATFLACQNTDKHLAVSHCYYCPKKITEEVDPDGECSKGGKHEWKLYVSSGNCAGGGFSRYECSECWLTYLDNLTDIIPDKHTWAISDDNGQHYCAYGCAEHGEKEPHTMENGRCTVCGYWPGHTEHKWEYDQRVHQCTYLGCELFSYVNLHTFDEKGVCTVCGYCQHLQGYKDGHCVVCGEACQHPNNSSLGQDTHQCSTCSFIDNHSWGEDGKCLVCGHVCTHIGYMGGKCVICGLACQHSTWSSLGQDTHQCPNCRQTEYHTWGEDSKCTVCNQECVHPGYNMEGKCVTCGLACQHTEYEGQGQDLHRCTFCGHEEQHTWENGECSVCGEMCDHDMNEVNTCVKCGVHYHIWNRGQCDGCGAVCEHEMVYEETPPTCVTYGFKPHYSCVVCYDLFTNTEGESLWDHFDDYYIPALGHDMDEEGCCQREDCDAKVTIAGTIEFGKEVKLNFTNQQWIDYEDVAERPLYRIEVDEEGKLIASTSQVPGDELLYLLFDVYDKNFIQITDLAVNYNMDDEITLTPGVYYLRPVSNSEELYDEILAEDWPITLHFTQTAVKGDVNGDGAVDIADLTKLIDVMKSNTTYEQRYDINNDSYINIKDVNALSSMLIEKGQ